MSLAAALARIASLDGVSVTSGIQAVDGVKTYDEGGDFRLVDIASIQEYGSKDGSIPPRPWMRTAYDKHHRKWIGMMDRAVSAKIKGRTGEAELRLLGVVMVGDLQESLLDGPWVPNAPSTIAAKGSDQPLFDTGQLNQSQRSAIEIPGQPPKLVG